MCNASRSSTLGRTNFIHSYENCWTFHPYYPKNYYQMMKFLGNWNDEPIHLHGLIKHFRSLHIKWMYCVGSETEAIFWRKFIMIYQNSDAAVDPWHSYVLLKIFFLRAKFSIHKRQRAVRYGNIGKHWDSMHSERETRDTKMKACEWACERYHIWETGTLCHTNLNSA